MKTALRRFPDSEAEWRHIPHLLCPGGCGKRSLFRKAPFEFLDECLVECSTEGCGCSRDYFEWQAVYAPIFEAIDIQMKRAERRQRLALI